MRLIVGLGNPGEAYRNTRHNAGFSVIKNLAALYNISFKKEKDSLSLAGRGRISDHEVILAMPLTFMNLSGIAVSSLLRKHRIELNNLLVVCDDLDLELGRIKIKSMGSGGGHNGLKSIINSLGSNEFARLRIGIGRPDEHDADASDYVLSPFSKHEKEQYQDVLTKASECCQVWVEQGIVKCMDIFNTRR